MRRIFITSRIEKLASDYLKEMLYKTRNAEISRACTQLEKLISEITNGRLVSLPVINESGNEIYPRRTSIELVTYIRKIKSDYIQLITITPSQFISKITEFESLISTDEISKIKFERIGNANGSPTHNEKSYFHEHLVRAMRYNYVQRVVFPKYIRALGIKTCVYCNSQYAITTRSHETLFQLDHCLPKSRYPYLCTSFFNLQPCCGSCNLRKSDNDMLHGKYFATIWRDDSDPDKDFFSFALKDYALARYLLSHEKDDLETEFLLIKESSNDLKSLHKDYLEFFKIDSLYSEHKDIAEEIIWKKYVYSLAYINSLRTAFKNWIKKDTVDVARLIMGNYMNADEIFLRPLSKFMQDIVKQLHFEIN